MVLTGHMNNMSEDKVVLNIIEPDNIKVYTTNNGINDRKLMINTTVTLAKTSYSLLSFFLFKIAAVLFPSLIICLIKANEDPVIVDN